MRRISLMISSSISFFKIVLQDVFVWTQSIAFFQLWIVLKFLDTITFFVDPLKWWICLCYAAWIEIQLNTTLSITLKIPKNNVPCFDSDYCLLSFYQVHSDFRWLSASVARGSSKLKTKVLGLYQLLHQSGHKSYVSKKSRLPQSGLLRKIMVIFFIVLSFIPSFVTALIRIPVAKLTHKHKIQNNKQCVNVSVLRAHNSQEDDDGYFSNFDSDTKLAVIDNAANVNV